ncbi:hypothetical protein CCV52592_1870 [Campylobacter curvus 525.92]|uniref:Uncharacterized protein n=1 Tax=Campylobacter curvus (strain 525.92) TaxID=360105 RepID=A7GYH5_CAMC5|nr:hypothetical protein CCV52592_1870 [Campylobacter curvus 525.92]
MASWRILWYDAYLLFFCQYFLKFKGRVQCFTSLALVISFLQSQKYSATEQGIYLSNFMYYFM